MHLKIKEKETLVWENLNFLSFLVPVHILLEEISKNIKNKDVTACSHNIISLLMVPFVCHIFSVYNKSALCLIRCHGMMIYGGMEV
jgi:hypothetical protein